MKYKLSEIVAKLGGYVDGEDITVSGISSIDKAKVGYITYLTDEKYIKYLDKCEASAIIINKRILDKIDKKISKIICDDSNIYFINVIRLFYPEKRLNVGVKNTALIDKSCIIGNNAAIEDNIIIGINTKIGDNCQIYPNVFIGDNVVIGDDVVIYPNVVIHDNVTIGNSCTFQSGCVIGSEGFGNVQDSKKKWHKKPQIGGVLIGNNVNVGANSTIDCGSMDLTIIEDGVIIDNLVQIAHNVKVGAYTAIAACVGIAGSTKIGKFCQLAGGCGITGHIEIADYTIIGGLTGIGKSIKEPGLYMGAYPFANYKDYAKNAIHIKQLHDMYGRLKFLESKISKLLGEDK